jgi:ABC-2 family transporter protein
MNATAPAATGRLIRPNLRIGWVTWRQQRLAYLATALSFVAVGVLLLVQGVQMRHYATSLGLHSCGALDGDGCVQPLALFRQRYETWAQYLPRFVLFIPAILGVFVAAPLVSREMETGTFRFAWTQGRSRTEWIVAKLVLVGVPITAVALLFSAVFSWWFEPFEPIMGRLSGGQAYEVVGVVFAARSLFALMLGALIGVLLRRMVPAMAVTGALWVATSWADIVYLRPLIAAPVSAPADSSLITRGGWVISEWLRTPNGAHISNKSSTVAALYRQARADKANGDTAASFGDWLTRHGYTDWVSYQPENRFWHFQLVDTAGYLVAAALLAAATVWCVRRRAD